MEILLKEQEAKDKLLVGINKLADTVTSTLGPYGKTIILIGPDGKPIVTKDGVSVADYIKLEDPIENTGAELIKQVATSTVFETGDGTTTSICLARALVNNFSSPHVDLNIPTSKIKQNLQELLEKSLKLIDTKVVKVDIKDETTLIEIAKISANGDMEVAQNVYTAINAVGMEGIVDIKESTNSTTEIDINSGFYYKKGYINSRFINVPEKGTFECGKAHILITNDRCDNFNGITPTLAHVVNELKTPLIVVAKEFSEDVIRMMLENFRLGNIIVPILAPDFGNNMNSSLEDLSIYTDTLLITNTALNNKTLPEGFKIGVLESVLIGNDFTLLVNNSNINKTSVRVKQLKNLLKKANNPHDKEKLKHRIASLSTGIATINVGGNSNTEIKELFDRYEDALGAVVSAIEDGKIPGGGILLYQISNILGGSSNFELAYKLALSAPIDQIYNNANCTDMFNHEEVMQGRGLDFNTNAYIDYLQHNILDPAKVTKTALIKAVNFLILYLSIGGFTSDKHATI